MVPNALELRLNETINVKHLEPTLAQSKYLVIISYYSKFYFPSVNEEKNRTSGGIVGTTNNKHGIL